MNVLIITKAIHKHQNAMDIRLQKLIHFFTNKFMVYVVCSFIEEIHTTDKKVKYLHLGNIPNIKFLRSVIYGKQIKKRIDQIIKKYNINIIYTQDPISMYNIKNKDVIKIYDVLGLMQSESTKIDNSIEAQIKRIYYKKIETKALANADYIITINNAHKNEIQKIASKQVFVLRDGTRKIFFNAYQKKESNNMEIVFVGSFLKDRLKDIIPKIPLLIKKNNKLRFKIIGDGSYIKGYKQIINKNDCQKNTTFLGYLNHIQVYENLKNADICFSDDWSYIGFPTKVFEYMAMGKAVLVEDTPAVREIIKDNVNGLLYTNSTDFVKKVLLMVKDNTLRERLGKCAKIDALNHTWEKRRKQFNTIIDEVLK